MRSLRKIPEGYLSDLGIRRIINYIKKITIKLTLLKKIRSLEEESIIKLPLPLDKTWAEFFGYRFLNLYQDSLEFP